jgi:hypothetical protein
LDGKVDVEYFINEMIHKSFELRCGVKFTYVIILGPMWSSPYLSRPKILLPFSILLNNLSENCFNPPKLIIQMLNILHSISQVNSEVNVSLLQYADDTLFIGEACVENLWAMKAVLRWFELVSRLKVNFSKSCLMGVNVPSSFLQGAASFLHCKLGSIPFIYLGLSVGANPD